MQAFSYSRNILPIPKVSVLRIIYPMKFDNETVYITSDVNVDHRTLPAAVAKHKQGDFTYVYVHRIMHLPPKRKKV